jgi:hypothetical protein
MKTCKLCGQESSNYLDLFEGQIVSRSTEEAVCMDCVSDALFQRLLEVELKEWRKLLNSGQKEKTQAS